MARRYHAAHTLKDESKDSLRLALWIGLPIGWVQLALCVIVYLAFGIHDAGAPDPAFFVCTFLLVFLGLGFAQYAVMRELKNRREEPSHFLQTLGKTSLLVFIGFMVFVATSLVSLFVLSRTTSMDEEHLLETSAAIAIAFVLAIFVIPAIKWTLSQRRKSFVEGDPAHTMADPNRRPSQG